MSENGPDSALRDVVERALETEPGEPNAMTLATASSDGRVSARTVLLRGVDRDGFDFFTNYNSRKGRQLTENPRASLVFYWGTLHRQVCVVGSVERLGAERSDAYFAARPRGHQIAAWASEQSTVIEDRAVLEERVLAFEREFAERDVPRPLIGADSACDPRRSSSGKDRWTVFTTAASTVGRRTHGRSSTWRLRAPRQNFGA